MEKKIKKISQAKFFSFAVLGLVLLISGFFRFVHLEEVPPGINVDETGIGYSAYSISRAGIDEWGNKYPAFFLSYGDNKSPGLIYSVAFLLNFFEPSSLVVRLPSAIAGFLAIVGVWLLVKELFPSKTLLPLFAAAIFSLTPWSFQLSRFFYESNIATTFFIFGSFFLLRFVKEKKNNGFLNILLAILFLGLSGYFYIAHRFISLAFVALALLFALVKKRFSFWKIFLFGLVYLLLTLPIFYQFFTSSGVKRLSQEGGLINYGAELIINEKRSLCYLATGKNTRLTKICYLFWNKPLLRLEKTAKSFAQHFSFGFLFIDGSTGGAGSNSRSVPGYGPFLFIFAPFYLLGVFVLIKKLINKNRVFFFLAIGAIISSIPSILSTEPTEHRALPMFVFIFLIIISGLDFFFSFFRKRIKLLLALLLVVLWGFSASRYLVNYFWVHTKNNDTSFRPDILLVADYLKDHQEEYDQIIFNDYREDVLLAIAFFNKIDPVYFAQEVERTAPNKYGWTFPYRLGKYVSGNFNLDKLVFDYNSEKDGRVLLITSPLTRKSYSKTVVLRIFDRYQVHPLTEIYDLANTAGIIQHNKQ